MHSSKSNVRVNRFVWGFVFLALIALVAWGQIQSARNSPSKTALGNQAIAAAFKAKQSGIQIRGEGTVARILPDDLDGSRHQRLVLKVGPNQTVLVTHNIDLAPRLLDVKLGDVISFQGEYQWNQGGGLVHWTHHDPAGHHPSGWLRHNNQTYQ